jgi:ubiquitin carboxyl-terminal hydrolase 22/27/51
VLCLPPLKAHYLSGGHAAAACAARRAARGADAGAPCLSCELDCAFAAAYAPPPVATSAAPGAPRPPWSPATLLAAWWRHAESLASYQQQDAHEFYLSLLSGVHAATAPRGGGGGGPPGLRSPSAQQLGSPRAGGGCGGGDADCACPVHRSFAGVLRSDVTCGRCGGVSTALDPFVDVSLELPPPPGAPAAAAATASSVGGDALAPAASASADHFAASVGACLRRFTRAERLGAAERVRCGACGAAAPGSTKQLSFAAAPPVLCLHLKRFSHAGTARHAASAKVDTHVAFPLDGLDLAPFLAPARLRARAAHRIRDGAAACDVSAAPQPPPPPPPPSCRYWLAAAVCHIGELDGGHYVSYARHGGAWYRCDDAWVTPVTPEEVGACKAYMLFYAAHAVTAQGPRAS